MKVQNGLTGIDAFRALCGLSVLVLCIQCTPEAQQKSSPSDADKKQEVEGQISTDPEVYLWPKKKANDAEVLLVAEEQRFAKNFYVILDGSGSMADSECSDTRTKAEVAVASLRTFAQKVPADANLGLLVFDDLDTSERVPLGLGNRPQFVAALEAMKVGGGTPLRTAIQKGLVAMERQARSQLGYGEYHIVVVTDGAANKGEDPKGVVYTTISKTPIIIHTVGFCIGQHHALNQPGLTVYKAANNPEELLSGLGQVLAESEKFDVIDFK